MVSATASQPQGSHLWIITLQVPGGASATGHGTFTPPAHWTRRDAFRAVLAEMYKDAPELTGANVLFFSLEPNRL
ncbi:hypothetical protein AR457_16450 [Streptomyces agglomeratus]|nr:hypothetical protein BGK70_20200 [Streptomyces agglomeratus]OEJ45484.1 hypothetical protein AR457_16450 [Streptomyces agglomeratus]